MQRTTSVFRMARQKRGSRLKSGYRTTNLNSRREAVCALSARCRIYKFGYQVRLLGPPTSMCFKRSEKANSKPRTQGNAPPSCAKKAHPGLFSMNTVRRLDLAKADNRSRDTSVIAYFNR